MSIDLDALIPFERIKNEPQQVFDLVDKCGQVILLKNNAPAYIIVKPEMVLGFQQQAAIPTITNKHKSSAYTLQEAMKLVLLETEGNQLHAAELADTIFLKGLYYKKNGSKAEYNQIRARCGHYPDMFEALPGNIIRLKISGKSVH
ncbi:hypothetical protein [Papillibacter cinnamivorans]|uniref:Antitoxin Phd n=1 Tax=Papillibacter cinnamivorans DSM 12816 TaxID=1122930 RepID=A0A1W2C9T8_9FIRM|nr:hypothetical protein [Papillibacter cinnamivorans]SMC81754.1 antitoxin Phd [Papillibacter cinnamivorans DSM 12816]